MNFLSLLFVVLMVVGYAKSDGEQQMRIVLGSNVQRSDSRNINFVVSFQHLSTDGKYYHSCGGSILNKRCFLTAAHCVFGDLDPTHYEVLSGTYDLLSGGTRNKVSRIEIHENYNGETITFDVAVVCIDNDFNFDVNTGSTTLATAMPADNTNCYVTGWGSTRPINKNTSQYLKLVDNIFRSTCFNSPSDQVCSIGFIGRGACNGDSGGPLVCDNVQIGIVSNGLFVCALASTKYTNVLVYQEWIQEKSQY